MNLIPFFLRSRAAALMAAILFIAGCGSSDDKSNVQGTRINPVTLFATIGTTAEQTASDALKDWKWSFIANFGDLLFRADYSLEMRKITYTSTGAEGTQQTLSGLLILPVSGGSDKPAVPILMYQHATQIYRPESPSQFLKNQDRPGDYPEVMVAAAIAATGTPLQPVSPKPPAPRTPPPRPSPDQPLENSDAPDKRQARHRRTRI